MDTFTILIGLAGGLALFLFGMEQMTDALKLAAGERMRRVLARLTTNRFKAAFAGAFVTAVIQSSSVTTVLVVGFISAGLMSLSQSIGVIMGANIGTTVTAQIIAFDVTQYALVLVAAGFAVLFAAKQERLRRYGAMVMGLGLLFYGMELMSEATEPLRSYPPFVRAMREMAHPALSLLAGAAFTAVVQSSSATTGVIIVLAGQGFITLETGIALAFGANVGTCVTALLASLGKPREAVRAAVVHVVFNVLGVAVWLGFVDPLAEVVRAVSPTAAGLEGAARLAAETPRQIANAHTLFNVANTLLFIGLTRPLARLVTWLVPERAAAAPEAVRPRYLDDLLLTTPALALDRVRMELRRLGERVYDMVEQAFSAAVDGDAEALARLRGRDEEVDVLHGAVVTYLGRLSQLNLPPAHAARLSTYLASANQMEGAGDLVETNFVETALDRLRTDVRMSAETKAVLAALHEKVCWALQLSLQALDASDESMARVVIDAKPDVHRRAREAETHLARRLTAEAPNRLAAFRVETELIEYLRRIYDHARRIAKLVAGQDG